MNQYIQLKSEEIQKVIDFFVKDISNLRTGRANPSLFDGIFVDAYEVKTPLNGLANINAVDSKSLAILPWDKNLIKAIEKAIVEADLGVSVVAEGDKIRVNIPQMTEENRRELVKKLNEKQEHSRIALRQVRDEIKDNIEQAERNKEISEDDKFRFLKELEEEIKKRNDELKTIRDKKEGEIMEI